MYSVPKNDYEKAMNDVYMGIDEFMQNGLFAKLEPVTARIEVIYRKLPYELQTALADDFYKLFCLTENEEDLV